MKKKITFGCLLLLSLLSGSPPHVFADHIAVTPPTFQRLFTTVNERVLLDQKRQRILHPKKIKKSGKKAYKQLPKNLSINGFILREDGKNTVWINGKATKHKSRTEHGVRIRTDKRRGKVRIYLPDSGKRISLKAGQSLNTQDGKIQESYLLEPPPPPQPKLPPPKAIPTGVAAEDAELLEYATQRSKQIEALSNLGKTINPKKK
jgi:hypothetical protein